MAHALGKIKNRNGALLLRVKYAHSHKPRDEANNGLYREFVWQLDRSIWMEICELWTRKRWSKAGKHQLFRRAMGQLALAEQIWPGQCMSCGGTMIQINNNKIEDCSGCGGRGRNQITEGERASLLGISEDEWVSWQGRYRKIQAIPRQWESDAIRELRIQLFMWPYNGDK